MAEPTDESQHRELLADVAEQYHLGEKSKVDIARQFGISRFQVARYLDEARATGIVEIKIHRRSAPSGSIASELAHWLGIHAVYIAAPDGGPLPTPAADVSADDRSRDRLAAHAARVIERDCGSESVLGISWSRTIQHLPAHLGRLQAAAIVQLAGALPVPGHGNPLQLVHDIAKRCGAETWPLWAPLLVTDAATAAGLLAQDEIADTLERADSLDISVVAIAGWNGTSSVWDRVDNAIRLEGTRSGAVAEVSGRLLDADGRAVHTSLDERVIAVTLDQLRHTPVSIGLLRGANNAPAALAAARARIVTTLVIDADVAEALNELRLRSLGEPGHSAPEPQGSHS
ncbi:Cro/Cl family transcriptional regulator [Micrococcales bacterium 31B]|nr:Cro/Cl family transcriptional regulator [Micrococcales bacterium 31B]